MSDPLSRPLTQLRIWTAEFIERVPAEALGKMLKSDFERAKKKLDAFAKADGAERTEVAELQVRYLARAYFKPPPEPEEDNPCAFCGAQVTAKKCTNCGAPGAFH